MNGYGSNTFANVNAEEKVTSVKYHFKTDQGIRNMPVDKAAFLAGADPDIVNRDLFEVIEVGEFSSWTLYTQTMIPEQAKNYKLIALDVTKVWSREVYPLKEVIASGMEQKPAQLLCQN